MEYTVFNYRENPMKTKLSILVQFCFKKMKKNHFSSGNDVSFSRFFKNIFVSRYIVK